MISIKPKWKEHPLYAAGKIELMPTEWVYQYRGIDVSPTTNLMDGSIVELQELWTDILANGLFDPLVIRIGVRNKKMRLEAGNHRIELLFTHGIPHVPVTVQLRDECGPHLGDVLTDGTHNFDVGDELLISSIVSEYLRPSEALRSAQNFTVIPYPGI